MVNTFGWIGCWSCSANSFLRGGAHGQATLDIFGWDVCLMSLPESDYYNPTEGKASAEPWVSTHFDFEGKRNVMVNLTALVQSSCLWAQLHPISSVESILQRLFISQKAFLEISILYTYYIHYYIHYYTTSHPGPWAALRLVAQDMTPRPFRMMRLKAAEMRWRLSCSNSFKHRIRIISMTMTIMIIVVRLSWKLFNLIIYIY